MNLKKIVLLLWLVFMFFSCNKKEDSATPSTINYKQEMRDFVIEISKNAKISKPNFFIIPQNGIELVTSDGDENGPLNLPYLNAIDGNGQEDLFYGYDSDDQATASNDHSYLRSFLDISKNAGNQILTTDYCSTPANMDNSYNQNQNVNYISFAADQRELNNIPDYPSLIFGENNADILNLSDAKNFLYLINSESFVSKTAFIDAIASTNYDLLIMDYFFHDNMSFTSDEMLQLKNKSNGGKRLVIAYMSIGEAEDYRYYWQTDWTTNKPNWMDSENPNWAGNFKVKYWDAEWQSIIFGNDDSYLNKILDANFDGVYLDIIDAFEHFE